MKADLKARKACKNVGSSKSLKLLGTVQRQGNRVPCEMKRQDMWKEARITTPTVKGKSFPQRGW